MRMFLFPAYVCLAAARANSPKVFEILKKMGVEVEEAYWGGTVDSIPTDKPSLVRASSLMSCKESELAQHCGPLRHFVYYDDRYLDINGNYIGADLEQRLTSFIEVNRQAAELSPQDVVEFLVSNPDMPTVDRGLHIQRQANLMLKLWDKYVLGDRKRPNTHEFGNEYPAVKSRPQSHNKESASVAEQAGFDPEGFNRLTAALKEDGLAIKNLEIDVDSQQTLALAYKHKLRRGLVANLRELQNSSHDTAASFQFIEPFIAHRASPPFGAIHEAMKSRHRVYSTSSGVKLLYQAMLPILLKEAAKVGYPVPTN